MVPVNEVRKGRERQESLEGERMATGDDDKLFQEAMKTLGVQRPSQPSAPARDEDEALIRRMALGLEAMPPQRSEEGVDSESSPSQLPTSDLDAEDATFETAMADLHSPQPTATLDDACPESSARQELERVHVGTPRALRRRIKQGAIRHDAELDLHGMTRDEALVAVEAFVKSNARKGLSVVRVITGRGLHSAGGEAVLMHALERWMEGPLLPWAYSSVTAPPSHGGEGMRYIFLRRFAPTSQ